MTNSSNKTDTTEVVRRLRAVTRRIEGFFESQIQRLEMAMHQLSELQSEYDVARRLSADLDQQRKEWQQERDAEIARLTQASEALACSWHDLEQRLRDRIIDENANAELIHPPTPPVPAPATEVVSSQPKMATHIHAESNLFEVQQLQLQVTEHTKRGR